MAATQKIKRMIEAKGITLRELANRANVPYATIKSVMIRGIENSSVDLVIRICHALGLTLDELFEEKKESEALLCFDMLNENGKKKVEEYALDLLCIKKYRRIE